MACCPPLSPVLSPKEAQALAGQLKALAHPVRLLILSALLDAEAPDSCTCELAPVAGVGEPTVSHHLKKLEAAGIVTKQRRGLNVYYRVVPDSLDAIARALHINLVGEKL